MVLVLQGHDFHFETENICRLFLPQEKILTVRERPEDADGVVATACLDTETDGAHIRCTLALDAWFGEETAFVAAATPNYTAACELETAKALYRLFVRLFGTQQSWGVVTGVRPVKLLRSKIAEMGLDAATAWMTDTMLVSQEKTALALRTWEAENRILETSRPESFSLYVSIPFCPTRCDYCSFVSHTTERSMGLIPTYLELLQQELRLTADIARELGLRLESVYFGGGTPTSLSAPQLGRLLDTVEQAFDLSTVREYTVEAGRPDTVTADKLQTIRAAGVDRVSINPQTLHDSVLQAIGRKHTAAQFYEAFDLARQAGFAHINTDLIVGLPTDTAEGFMQTLDGIRTLHPENVTVHTLSMKRASNLVVRHLSDYSGGEQAAAMTAYADRMLTADGYHPYYLYRQARMVGGQENVGWSLDGHDGLYNVWIMDETQTILACGAGASTKLKQPNGPRIERIFNHKFPYEYNDRFAELVERKNGIREFYSRYPLSSEDDQ